VHLQPLILSGMRDFTRILFDFMFDMDMITDLNLDLS
jgi:hypothetical protein